MQRDLATLASDHPMLTDDGSRLLVAADTLLTGGRVRLDRLWNYYRNPMRVDLTIDPTGQQRPYRQAQEWGLPTRITGQVSGENVFDASVSPDIARKEVVIENDIGWRIETHVNVFQFNATCPTAPHRPRLESKSNATDAARAKAPMRNRTDKSATDVRNGVRSAVGREIPPERLQSVAVVYRLLQAYKGRCSAGEYERILHRAIDGERLGGR